jgi:hypothetical protein
MDPGYRMLFCIGYADDHPLGFAGPRAEAEEIKGQAGGVLARASALALSDSKTLITRARTRAARFLGHEITVRHWDTRLTKGRRSANGLIGP